MGLLEGLAAGIGQAAQGLADTTFAQIQSDIQQSRAEALYKVQQEMELAKEDTLYKRNQTRKDEERQRVGGMLNEIEGQYDTNVSAQPGGWDPNDPQGKNRRKFSELDQGEQASVIRKGMMDRGEYGYADQYNKDIDRFDKNAAASARNELQSQLLDLKRQGLLNEYEYKNKVLEIQGELNSAKMGKIKAEIETLQAKAAGGGKGGDKGESDTMAPLNTIQATLKSAFGLDQFGKYSDDNAAKYRDEYSKAVKRFNAAKKDGKDDRTAVEIALSGADTPKAPVGENGKKDFSSLWGGKK